LSDSLKFAAIDRRALATGALLAVVGGAAALQALAFDQESRMFPLVVATLLGITGIAIAAQTLLRPKAGTASGDTTRGVLVAVLLIGLWAAAFGAGAGFVLPTFALQTSLLWLTGVRRPGYIASVAALVTAFAYLLFVVLLDIPLPPSFLPGVLQEF
jgi:hypothetical protein